MPPLFQGLLSREIGYYVSVFRAGFYQFSAYDLAAPVLQLKDLVIHEVLGLHRIGVQLLRSIGAQGPLREETDLEIEAVAAFSYFLREDLDALHVPQFIQDLFHGRLGLAFIPVEDGALVDGLFAGIGLLKLRPWGRILGIVMSIVNLLYIPIGTIVGIYGLWVLFSKETEGLFTETPA